MNQATEQTMTPTQAFAEALVVRMLTKVEQFNREVTALPIPSAPTMLNGSRAEWSVTALTEEVSEFESACEAGDILEAADGLLDMVFFALGRLTEMGVPAMAVWDSIVKANMMKQRGELSKRPGSLGHDAVKPEGWKAPDHSWLLTFSLADLEKARLFDELSPVFQRITRLRAAKGDDYNNVPGGRDAYFPFGHMSYAHMLQTKNLRIQSLIASMQAGKKPNFEGLLDTVEDLINYAAFYAEAMRDNRLPTVAVSQEVTA